MPKAQREAEERTLAVLSAEVVALGKVLSAALHHTREREAAAEQLGETLCALGLGNGPPAADEEEAATTATCLTQALLVAERAGTHVQHFDVGCHQARALHAVIAAQLRACRDRSS